MVQISPGQAARTVGAVAIALIAVGCGGSSSGAKAEEGKTPTQVFADAKSALFNAKAVHATGTVSGSGSDEQIDLQLQDQETSGTITEAGQKLQIIETGGTVYLNAPAAFWTKTVGAQAAPLADKWIKATAAQAGDLSQLTLQGLAAEINTDDSPLTGSTAKATVDGQKALLLTEKDGSQLYVSDSSAPVPLKVVNHGSSEGTLTFTDYGDVKTITAPPGAVTPEQAVGSPTPTA